MRAFFRLAQGHVAVVAFGAVAGAAALQGVPLCPALAVLAALGAWAMYVGERLVAPAPEDVANHPARTRFFAVHRRALRAAAAAALAGCVVAWLRLPGTAQAASAGVALAGTAYALPSVRRSALAKTALVAGVWGAGAGLLPPLAVGQAVGARAVAVALAVGLLVAVNALLLDALDAHGDRAAGRRTFAARLALSPYRRLVAGVMLAAAGAMAGVVHLSGLPAHAAAWAFVPHAMLGVGTARLSRLRPPDGLWLDLAVGALGFVALAQW